MIPISKPIIENEEKIAVLKVLESGMIAQGKKVKEFENKFALYIGTKYAIAVSSGTCALDLAIKSLDKKPKKVLTSPLTFIASANCALMNGAKVDFVDVEPSSYNMDPYQIKGKADVLIPVHLYGNPCNMKRMMEVAKEKKMVVIEDCAQAPGAEYFGKKVGSFGDMGIFSFYAVKNMTTGEGGMITTNNKKYANRLKLLRDHGQRGRYNHVCLGYNYRMTDIAAAMGIAQLKKLERFTKKRIANARYLSKHLEFLNIIQPWETFGKRHVFSQYAMISTLKSRRHLLKKLNDAGIQAKAGYKKLVYNQPSYSHLKHNECPEAEKLSKELILLPVHPSLTKEDLDKIVEVIENENRTPI